MSDIVQTRVQPLYLQSELWLIPVEILGFVMQMEQKMLADFTLALLSGAQWQSSLQVIGMLHSAVIVADIIPWIPDKLFVA